MRKVIKITMKINMVRQRQMSMIILMRARKTRPQPTQQITPRETAIQESTASLK